MLCLALAAGMAPMAAFADPSGAPSSAGPGAVGLAPTLAAIGFENVRVDSGAAGVRIAYENRRWRHAAEALGRAHRAAGGPVLAFEQRFGLTAAAIATDSTNGRTRFDVRYPSDAAFPTPPRGPRHASTARSVDLEVRPLLTYELGRLLEPVLVRFEVEPFLRTSPWPGAMATVALTVPWRNDFAPDPLHPDVGRVRPGPFLLEQYAWLPRAALVSGTAGYFGDNRYGVSAGAARPVAGGRLLFDAQADLTGFVSFGPDGVAYSRASLWTGFVSATWRPPVLDLALRARGARFLFGDRGGEFEARRTFGDIEMAYFVQRTAGVRVFGVRLDLPIPPAVRMGHAPVRVMPTERFPIDYRSRSEPLGLSLKGIGSREEFLRQLATPTLEANRDRYARGLTGARPERATVWNQTVSLTGTTGFINTPWAGTMPDRRFEAGHNRIPKSWAYDNRGQHDNEVNYVALGFLPRVETSIRWTVLPGLRTFEGEAPESRLTDTDYMASGRIALLEPRSGRPGLALGVDDVEGTRRFHSSYAVAGFPFSIRGVQQRFSLGYAFRAFNASHYVLDGTFGAFEIRPVRSLATQIEYDTEKWNAGASVEIPLGFQLRAALLHLETLSVGAGWQHAL